jgi:hypothetical protein
MLIAFAPAGKMEAFFREAAVPDAPPMLAKYDMPYVAPPLLVG